MNRPSRKQWLVLGCGAIWVVLNLLFAERYAVASLLAAAIVCGLFYAQLAPDTKPAKPEHSSATGDKIEQKSSSMAVQPQIGSVGVRGWLMLLSGILTIFLPFGAVVAITNAATSIEDGREFVRSLVILVGIATGSAYAAIAIGRRWQNAPKIAARFLFAIVGLNLLGFFVRNGSNLLTFESAEAAGYLTGQLLGTLTWPLIGIAYLRKSRRVKNTYANASMDGTRERTFALAGIGAIALLLTVYGAVTYSR
jgi:hypothetical protein